jgi:type II secretion system protein G
MRDQRGFTLLEMMVVVAIIAILAAILIPNFTRARAQAQTSACMGNVKIIATALELYFTDHQQYPAATGSNVDSAFVATMAGYLSQVPVDPAAGTSTSYYQITTTQASSNNGVAGYTIWCPGSHDPATLTTINGGVTTTNMHIKYDNQKGFQTASAAGS